MTQPKIKGFEILGESLQAMLDNKQLFLLLIALNSVLTMLLMWPMMDWYLLLLENFPDNLDAIYDEFQALVEADLGYLYLMVIPSLLLSFGVAVLWSRAAAGGTKIAFEGGLRALFIRILRVFWRYLCALAILLVVVVPLVLLATVLENPDSGFVLAVFLIYLLYMVFLFVVTFLLSVSIHGEARDFSLPIHKSYLYLKGNILRATGALAAGMIGVYIVQSMVMVILMGMLFSGSKIGLYFAFFIMFAISSIVNFLWVGFGARYAIRLVPDLKI